MRCKSCNSDMSDIDHARKDPSGGFVDLCSPCYAISEQTLYETTSLEDEPSESLERPSASYLFNMYVLEKDLINSWSDGLGLKWASEERYTHMYRRCFMRYLELYEAGWWGKGALEYACGLHRGDQTMCKSDT